jgi:hypothetical protein
MLLPAAAGRMSAFRGGYMCPKSRVYQFNARVLGKKRFVGCFKPEEAEEGARKYDSLQLLLYGPRAKTNFEWSSYTQADVAAAAQFLQAKGLDVHQAVIDARQSTLGGQWHGVALLNDSWSARVCRYSRERTRLYS